MLSATEVHLNRFAQGLDAESRGTAWFESQTSEEKAQTLRALVRICKQAHPLQAEVIPAIERAGLKPTFTPCVMLKSAARPEHTFEKLVDLPAAEAIKTFRLLLALFAIADTRRRATQCKGGCTHEWHNLPAL